MLPTLLIPEDLVISKLVEIIMIKKNTRIIHLSGVFFFIWLIDLIHLYTFIWFISSFEWNDSEKTMKRIEGYVKLFYKKTHKLSQINFFQHSVAILNWVQGLGGLQNPILFYILHFKVFTLTFNMFGVEKPHCHIANPSFQMLAFDILTLNKNLDTLLLYQLFSEVSKLEVLKSEVYNDSDCLWGTLTHHVSLFLLVAGKKHINCKNMIINMQCSQSFPIIFSNSGLNNKEWLALLNSLKVFLYPLWPPQTNNK